MAIICPNCHEVVKSTDGFCESCGLKIDDLGSSGGNSSQPQKISNEASSARSTTGDKRKFCINQKCTSYNVEYGIDDNYCGVCGSELAAERLHKEQQLPQQEQQQAKPQSSEEKKRGFLVMPDKSQIEITTTTQMPIGIVELSKFVPEENRNHISRVHITVSGDGQKYFVEDGKTDVQEKPSRNKTWIISGDAHDREEITDKGRRELKDGDEINIADTVILSFILK